MKLSELREVVRTQTETVSNELPDSTIDWYLRQAYDRTIAFDNEWPFFQKTWFIELPIGEASFALPADVNEPGLQSLRHVDRGYRLEMMSHNEADEWFGYLDPAMTYPVYYSVWEHKIWLWPKMTYATAVPYELRGHRLPVDWIALGPDGEPDCDERLHRPLTHYAIALAYAQQEDDELEDVYMRRWNQDINRIVPSIIQPVHNRPLVMGPRTRTPIGYRSTWPVYTISAP